MKTKMNNIKEENQVTTDEQGHNLARNEEFVFPKTIKDIIPIASLRNYSQDKSAEYVKVNQIDELFQILCTSVLYFKPHNVKEFLIKELKRIKEHGMEYYLENPKELNFDNFKLSS